MVRGTPFSTEIRKRQSPFDCRWVVSDALSAAKDADWVPLLPGHGIISFTKPDGQPAERIYDATDTAAPAELPIPAKNVPRHAVVTSRSKTHISSRRSRPRLGTAPILNLPSRMVVFPARGADEEICVPTDAANTNALTYWPSRIGVLRAVSVRTTPHGEKPGDLSVVKRPQRKDFRERISLGNERVTRRLQSRGQNQQLSQAPREHSFSD